MAQSSQNESTYLVLASLEDGQKYGLEIIEAISKRTGGNYIMKKPTLYSALTRLEKKGLLSSTYWGESEFGGKRHYYDLTKDGRKELYELSKTFADYDFSKDFSNDEAPETKKDDATFITDTLLSPSTDSGDSHVYANDATSEETAEKPAFLQQRNLFDMAQQKEVKEAKTEELSLEEDEEALENQLDFFTLQNENTEKKDEMFVLEADGNSEIDAKNADENETKPTESDAKFLSDSERIESAPLTADQEAQNRKIYDSSAEFKRLSRKKSFSDNQIEMAVEYENEEDEDEIIRRRESLKESLLSARKNHYTEDEQAQIKQFTSQSQDTPASSEQQVPQQSSPLSREPAQQNFAQNAERPQNQTYQNSIFNALDEQTATQDKEEEEERKDDAVFITSRIEQHEIPISRKIAPTNLDVDIDDSNMPAPKRNANLEPTYKDMMSRLFEQKKEREIEKRTSTAPQVQVAQEIEPISDYASLKKYYSQHDIEFREHTKGSAEINHNSSFLSVISSTILLLLSGIFSAIFFWIIYATNNLNPSSNCLFYVVPILLFAYVAVLVVRWRLFPNKKSNPPLNALSNWGIFILGTIVVLIINVAMGMQFDQMGSFLTTLLLPILALLLFFPINYHLTKYLYDRFGK